jgi:hypothetical protein
MKLRENDAMVDPTIKEDLMSAVDDLMDTGFFSGPSEELDLDVLEILEDYEMESTMNSVKTYESLGQLTVDGDDFVATFTEMGSAAVSVLSYKNDILTVTFRNKPDTQYQYTVSKALLKQIHNELDAVLGQGEGSIGKLIQKNIQNNSMQLI